MWVSCAPTRGRVTCVQALYPGGCAIPQKDERGSSHLPIHQGAPRAIPQADRCVCSRQYRAGYPPAEVSEGCVGGAMMARERVGSGERLLGVTESVRAERLRRVAIVEGLQQLLFAARLRLSALQGQTRDEALCQSLQEVEALLAQCVGLSRSLAS